MLNIVGLVVFGLCNVELWVGECFVEEIWWVLGYWVCLLFFGE